MKVLGVNAVFHDAAAAIIVDGQIIAATEEERLTRRKSRKRPVPFSNWEIPELSARACLRIAGLAPEDLDAVAYSYDPALVPPLDGDVSANYWEGLRTLYVRKAGEFLSRALPGLDASCVRYVDHHTAHAASAYLAAPVEQPAVMVVDGRGEVDTALLGWVDGASLKEFHRVRMPNSLGLFYEFATEHLGFRRSADEYKVMGLAAYGTPRFDDELSRWVRATDNGRFVTEPVDWARFNPRRLPSEPIEERNRDLAASVQRRLEEILLAMARWLRAASGRRSLVLAGGVAFNCVANARLAAEAGFDEVWVQPAAGDAGTALGAALHLASLCGDRVEPMRTARLGRAWDDSEIEAALRAARVPFTRHADIALPVADALANNAIVGWFNGRSEFGPRALGGRSLLAHPGDPRNLHRLNDVKGREEFRPLAPIVLASWAPKIFRGQLPSPYMLFTHRVNADWSARIPAVVHVDGTSRVQTVNPADEPELASLLEAFRERTGLPVLVNTSFNTADRPIVDSPRDALECFGSAPIDMLAFGSCLIVRPGSEDLLRPAAGPGPSAVP